MNQDIKIVEKQEQTGYVFINQPGFVWLDCFDITCIVCCPNCAKHFYGLTKKHMKKEQFVKSDDCCNAEFRLTQQGFEVKIR